MIKHVVLFQLKEETSHEEKLKVINSFKRGILSLPTVIPQIRRIEVGVNVNEEEYYDVALVGEFDSLNDVSIYAQHPAHIEVAQIIKPFVKSRACTDYEVE